MPTRAFAIVLLAGLPCLAQESQPLDRVARWRADLAFLADTLPRRHVAPFAHVAEAAFRARVAALEQDLPGWSDERAILALAGLVAMLGDSHTSLDLGPLLGAAVPLGLHGWSDGIRVHLLGKEHAALLGSRVVAVGGVPVAEAGERLCGVVPLTNPALRRARIPNLIVLPRLLHALELAPAPDRARFTLEDDAGRRHELELAPGRLGPDAARVRPKRIAVTGQRGQRWHHYEHLAGEGILYVQYNRCQTSPQHDLNAFGSQLEALLRDHAVHAVVFDLQYNGGGSSLLGDLLFARLAQHPPMDERRNVFCIVGPDTFSSAILNAQALKARHGAVWVGSPTGGTANHFGEVKVFELPHSRLRVHHSTKRFGAAKGREEPLQPDLVVERTFADFVAGDDPVLDAIRARLAAASRPAERDRR
ncbi:MAG: hypothetical protein IT458_01935 [Planctomycetes bacterium]|nr:hypothetical protein [Planctomycetota bacterium]